MRIVCISDTHNKHHLLNVPSGDILIHAGDISSVGHKHEVERFIKWFGALPHTYKILISGNHDFYFEQMTKMMISHHLGIQVNPEIPLENNIIYLKDSSIIIDGIKIYGSPWTPVFYNWAFMKNRGEEMKEVWQNIPSDTDILITHGPPHEILDECSNGDRAGCEELREKIWQLNIKYHIFGHIHDGYGIEKINNTTFINASVLDDNYLLVNDPIIIDM